MHTNQSYEVSSKENFYFALKVLFSILIYTSVALFLINIPSLPSSVSPINPIYGFVFYAFIIICILLFQMGLLVGYIRGNAVKITEYQFPDLHKILVTQSNQLGLRKIPETYILEQGGFLNAFATRFIGRDYVILYSEIVDEAYNNNIESLEFIIAHELGHVKRKHISKNLLLFPSLLVPFLNSAYSRACEYTCDNIGAALSPKGAIPALLMLSSGKTLFRKVNIDHFVKQQYNESGFWMSVSEIFSSHPMLVKRVDALYNSPQANTINKYVPEHTNIKTDNLTAVDKKDTKPEKTKLSSDHSKYMPQ